MVLLSLLPTDNDAYKPLDRRLALKKRRKKKERKKEREGGGRGREKEREKEKKEVIWSVTHSHRGMDGIWKLC